MSHADLSNALQDVQSAVKQLQLLKELCDVCGTSLYSDTSSNFKLQVHITLPVTDACTLRWISEQLGSLRFQPSSVNLTLLQAYDVLVTLHDGSNSQYLKWIQSSTMANGYMCYDTLIHYYEAVSTVLPCPSVVVPTNQLSGNGLKRTLSSQLYDEHKNMIRPGDHNDNFMCIDEYRTLIQTSNKSCGIHSYHRKQNLLSTLIMLTYVSVFNFVSARL